MVEGPGRADNYIEEEKVEEDPQSQNPSEKESPGPTDADNK